MRALLAFDTRASINPERFNAKVTNFYRPYKPLLAMAKIIVLEDEASTRLVICGVLKKFGHEVIGVDNGAEGLLIILAEQPDLVISDVQMPKLSGLEVLAQMRQNEDLCDTPLVLLTSLGSRADMRAGMSQGANDYISKPFEPQELIDSVNAQLALVQQRQSKRDAQGQVAQAQGTQPPHASQTADAAHNAPYVPYVPMVDGVVIAPKPVVQLPLAWVVHVAVHNAAGLTQRMDPKDWRLLLRNLYSPRGNASALKTASHVDFAGNNLTVVFVDTQGQAESAALRAARAVADMVLASGICKRWMATNFAGKDMPTLKLMVNVHAGPVGVAKVPLGAGIVGTKDQVQGPSIDLALTLRNAQPSVMWTVLATDAAVGNAPDIYRVGAHQTVALGVQDIKVHALLGLDSRVAAEGAASADWV
jgi:CheY-like chemotaxis protein